MGLVISKVVLYVLFFADPAREVFEAAVRSLSSGDLSGAEHGFQQVLKTSPNHIGALGNLGVVYIRMDRPADAIGIDQRALKLAPKDPQLNLNLGLAHLKQDDHGAARSCFERVLTADPSHAQARHLLAVTQLFTNSVDKAVTYFEASR